MRILRFLLSSFVFFAIFAVVGGLVVREALLFAGTSMVRSSLTVLHKISRDNLQFARQCRERGGITSDVPTIGGIQLRFITGNRYVVEVVCSQFSSDPILVEQYTLPPFVKKTAGTSGIIWSKERSAVELEVFGRRRVIGIENEEIKAFTGGSVTLGRSPVSTCEGFGYACCQAETHSGTGQPYANVLDCPRSCYAQCIPRPLILSLNTDPFVDESTRTTTTLRGEAVTFAYVVSYDQKEDVMVTIDFGDGQQESFSTLTGKTSHTYACAQASCQYTVRLTARSASGAESAATAITQLTVRIQ